MEDKKKKNKPPEAGPTPKVIDKFSEIKKKKNDSGD